MKSQRFSISALILLVGFISCREKERYRMSRDKLKDVVRDMYLVDVNVSAHPKAYRDSISDIYMKQITKIHRVSREDIEHDIRLLQSDFSLLDSLYEEILKEADEWTRLKRDGKKLKTRRK